jgi:hypothetical protein
MRYPFKVEMSLCIGLALLLVSCSQGTTIVNSKTDSSWQPSLTSAQIAVVQSVFPDFQPELFKPGTNPSMRTELRVANFQPARFFGQGNGQSQFLVTPGGVHVEAHGFDIMTVPPALPMHPPYFEPDGTAYSLDLRLQTISALHKIEERLGLPLSPSGPWIEYDPTNWQVSASEIDRILTDVQASLARRLPQVLNVPLSRCQVAIEPTIFWVRNSNFGDTWAVGLTQSLSGGDYRLHLALFYVSGERVQNDWRRVLIDEGINCFVLSIARPDLAR